MSEGAFKMEEAHKKKIEEHKRKFTYLLDEDHTEVKRLSMEDLEEAVKIMRKCAFDVTETDVKTIIVYNNSFGCYVNRMLIGVGLAWPAHLNLEQKILTAGEPNAIYLEDPAVLLAYEGRGLRRVLLHERENEGKKLNLKYAIAYLAEDMPKGTSIEEAIKEGGSQLEKLYLSEGYKFFRTDRGIMALKEL